MSFLNFQRRLHKPYFSWVMSFVSNQIATKLATWLEINHSFYPYYRGSQDLKKQVGISEVTFQCYRKLIPIKPNHTDTNAEKAKKKPRKSSRFDKTYQRNLYQVKPKQFLEHQTIYSSVSSIWEGEGGWGKGSCLSNQKMLKNLTKYKTLGARINRVVNFCLFWLCDVNVENRHN